MIDYLNYSAEEKGEYKGVKGLFRLEEFEVEAIDILTHKGDGNPLLNPNRSVTPGVYTRLVFISEDGSFNRVIMSDTPAERKDHTDFFNRAKGRVLVGGLGIGLCIEQLIYKRSKSDRPKQLVIIENNPAIIRLMTPYFIEWTEVLVVQADVFKWSPDSCKPSVKYPFDSIWMDIWDEISDRNEAEMTTLARKYTHWKTREGYFGCWARAECKWMRDIRKAAQEKNGKVVKRLMNNKVGKTMMPSVYSNIVIPL